MKTNTFLLKSLPYLSSVCAGIGVYYLSKNYLADEQLFDLMTNVSASLLSIPLVFLFYEYSEFLVNRRVNKTLAAGLIEKINFLMLQNLLQMRKAMCEKCKITWHDIDNLLFGNFQVNYKKLSYSDNIIYKMKSYYEELEAIVYRSNKTMVLQPQQVQILSFMLRDMSDLLGEYKLRKNRQELAHYTEDVMELMGEWFATVGSNKLRLQNLFKLILDKKVKNDIFS